MKRAIYATLSILSAISISYVIYYVYSHKIEPTPIVEAPAPVIATTTPQKVEVPVYTTKSGKKIKVEETNPSGESLSTITISTEGFATNTPIVLETNRLTNYFYADLNNDSFEELIITTTAQGSGSFGEAFIYTSASSTILIPVTIPELTEKDSLKGGLFEGYMGHDSFMFENNKLTREFPTYKATDIQSEPTGPKRAILYNLQEKNGAYFITYTKASTTLQMIATTTQSIATSTQANSKQIQATSTNQTQQKATGTPTISQ